MSETEAHLIEVSSLQRSLLTGGIGFGLASLSVFATVAFGERWMYEHLGLLGAYLVWTALFIFLGGGVLGSLVVGCWRLTKFYALFGLAFSRMQLGGWLLLYLRGTLGEWVGSLAGSLLMGLVLALGFGVVRSAFILSGVLFVANSLGYFLGSTLNNYITGSSGMLLWGTVYDCVWVQD